MSAPPRPDDPHDDPVAHDAWLREALRHAPDANAAPPGAVRDTILRAAQAEALRGVATARGAAAASPSVLRQLAALWAWLARPPVAAGFAGLMVATVVGLMWWDRPLEEALPPREVTTAAPAPAEAPAPAATPAPEAPVVAPAGGDAPRRDAATAAPRAKAPAAPAPKPAPAPVAREPDAERRRAEARDEAVQQREAGFAAKSADAERRAATSAAESALGAAVPAPAAAPPRPAPSALAVRAAPAAALGALRATIATEPERWSWQRDGGATVPMGTPVMQWLQRLGETARGRWTPQPDRAEASAAAARPTTVVLLHDGRVHTTLRLGAESIELDSGAQRQRAELPAAEATALRVELDQATR